MRSITLNADAFPADAFPLAVTVVPQRLRVVVRLSSRQPMSLPLSLPPPHAIGAYLLGDRRLHVCLQNHIWPYFLWLMWQQRDMRSGVAGDAKEAFSPVSPPSG